MLSAWAVGSWSFKLFILEDVLMMPLSLSSIGNLNKALVFPSLIRVLDT